MAQKTSIIAIRPYVNYDDDNMGLTKYNMVLFEGALHIEPLAYKEQNGLKRYLTGLNEFAPEILELEPLEKEAAILDIRKTVAHLEKLFVSNIIDPNDEDFWNKVKYVKNDNTELWDKIIIEMSNDPVFLEPIKNPMDLLKIKAIENKGFSLIAKSLEEAKRKGTYKFYLDRNEESASVRTEVKKLRNKALAELQKMYEKNTNKLFLVCKSVDPLSTQYRKDTPHDILYDNMDKYINGESVEKDKKKTAQTFLDIVALDLETLKLKAMIRDAKYYGIIGTRPDGFIYHLKTSTMIGKNPTEVITYLKNPLSEDILKDITTTIEKHWNS
jgi:hypothetical protein